MSQKQSSSKNRIIPLVFGFLVLFVVTFSLGVIVGKGISDRSYKAADFEKRKSEEQHTPEKPDTLDEEIIAYREQAPMPSPAAETSKPDERSQESGEADIKVKEDLQEVVLEETPPTPEPMPAKKPEPTAKPEPTVKPTPVPTKTPPAPKLQKKTREAAIEEIAKTNQNKTGRRVKLPPIDPQGTYTVQIGSFTDKSAADTVLKSMKSKGYPAFINTKTDSHKKKWYRVRIGTFNHIESATEYGDNLKILEPEVKIVFITQNK